MNDKIVTEFFNRNTAAGYDDRAVRIGSIMDNLHFLIRLVLQSLPTDANILCVGVGTGTEIARLARIFPQWRFTGVDPSEAMLDVCRRRVEENGLSSRCELVHGYVQDVAAREAFDGVLCLLVAHFLKGTERQALFDEMALRLRPNGYLITAEICFDLASPGFGSMLEQWKAVHRHAGATEENLAGMRHQLEEVIAVLPPQATEELLRNSGLPLPVQFFQSLLIRAWYARKAG
jgi:tRNA (cmo5U34)-methyltransferase